jgi:hypothetical protein
VGKISHKIGITDSIKACLDTVIRTLQVMVLQEIFRTDADNQATTATATGAVYMITSVNGYRKARQRRPKANNRYWRKAKVGC